MSVTEKLLKAERIELRVTLHEKALLMAAAQSRHTTVSDFLLDHGIEAAERELTTPRVFYATAEGWAAIQKLLEDDQPSARDEATIRWLTKHRSQA